MKILLIGIDRVSLRSIQYKTGDQITLLSALTAREVERTVINNPDINVVVFICHITETKPGVKEPTTAKLIPEVRRMLGDGVKFITSSPNKRINQAFMNAGCDETVAIGSLCTRLRELNH